MSIDIKKESKLLAKHSIVYGFGNMLNNLAAFLLLPIYTRYLTPTDYGVKELVGECGDCYIMTWGFGFGRRVRGYRGYD